VSWQQLALAFSTYSAVAHTRRKARETVELRSACLGETSENAVLNTCSPPRRLSTSQYSVNTVDGTKKNEITEIFD
jgi:hypothetical protein